MDSLQSYSTLTIESPVMEDEIEGERRLGSYPLGYLDCINLAIMKRSKVNTIYSSDKGFDSVPGLPRILEQVCKDREFADFLKWARQNL